MMHPIMSLTYFISQQDSKGYSETLARSLGILRAIVLGQLIWWTASTAKHNNYNEEDFHFRDGRWWIYWKDEDLEIRFYEFKLRTVRDCLRDLEDLNLIVTRTDMNSVSFDRKKWYTPNDKAVDAYIKLWDSMGRPIRGENGARSKDIKAFVEAWEEVKGNYTIQIVNTLDNDPQDTSNVSSNVPQTDDDSQDTSNVSSEHTSNVPSEHTSNGCTISSSTSSTNNILHPDLLASPEDEVHDDADALENDDEPDDQDDSDAKGKEKELPQEKEVFDLYDQVGAKRDYNEGGPGKYETPTLLMATVREVFPGLSFYKTDKLLATTRKVFSPDGEFIASAQSLEELCQHNPLFLTFVRKRCIGFKGMSENKGQKSPSANTIIKNLLKVHHVHASRPDWHGWLKWASEQGFSQSKAKPKGAVSTAKKQSFKVSKEALKKNNLEF